MTNTLVADALLILKELGLPRAQQNERSALCLLALLNLIPGRSWPEAQAPLLGITPLIEFAALHFGKKYAPNTRETIRRQTMHQFVDAGVSLYNPDDPKRPVNSPKAVYQIEPAALALLRTYGSENWLANLSGYLANRPTLIARYARERALQKISVQLTDGQEIQLSPGTHSHLIKAIIDEFAPRFVPGAQLIYVGDTGEKWGYFNTQLGIELGVNVDSHGKMPDVVLYDATRNWLILVESVTSHGPVDGKRRDELTQLFGQVPSGLVYVTAFPSRTIMARYLAGLAWETEVWVADAPTHLIHLNGERFLGPY